MRNTLPHTLLVHGATAASSEQMRTACSEQFWLQVMYGHHVATLGLVSLSYFNGWQPIGAAERFAGFHHPQTRKQQGFDLNFDVIVVSCRV